MLKQSPNQLIANIESVFVVQRPMNIGDADDFVTRLVAKVSPPSSLRCRILNDDRDYAQTFGIWRARVQ